MQMFVLLAFGPHKRQSVEDDIAAQYISASSLVVSIRASASGMPRAVTGLAEAIRAIAVACELF